MPRMTMSLIFALTLAPAECFADASEGTPVVQGLTPRRAVALVGMAMAVLGVVIAAQARRRKRLGLGNSGRRGAVVALALGVASSALGVFVVATAPGGLGTGGGLAGGVISAVVGSIALVLSGITLRRS